MRRLPLFFSVLVALMQAAACAATIPDGAGSFKSVDAQGNADRPITVWTYRPKDLSPNGKIVFVMHGQSRNGEVYRDSWIDIARQQKFLLLTPEFSDKFYPSETMYQLGFVTEEDGSIRDKDKWSLSAIEHLFDFVVKENSLEAKCYTIYGHSGGGQFVHRFVLLCPQTRCELAIAANPGWYTMPDFKDKFPYGLKDAPTDQKQLDAVFAKPLIVLLGEDDTDPNHNSLRRTPEAMLQGEHRFERGHNFYRRGKEMARQQGVDFNWKLETVPHVGHSNPGMAPAAGRIILQQSRPSDAAMKKSDS